MEPFAIICMMQVYFRTIEGQTPDPAWDARLSEMSGKFRTLKERALSAAPGGAAPQAPLAADPGTARV